MADSAILREVTLTLPILPDMEIAAGKTATALAESMQMTSDRIDEVRMAVVEACINSFEHSGAADRKVHITFSVLGRSQPETLQISISDSGIGFDPQAVEKPRIEEKLRSANKRGWGLEIIRGLMDDVQIESGAAGTTIVMTKHRQVRRAGE